MNNQKSKYKNNKGITLIALIITIVVLLILAVVAIGAVTNDGIINYAKNAREEYGKSGVNENTTLEGYFNKIEDNLPITIEEAMQPKMLTKTVNSDATDKYGNKIVIPAGFKIIADDTTGYTKETIDVTKGIVIEDSQGNQFVWVPVENVYYSETEYKTITLGRYVNFTANSKGEYVPSQTATDYATATLIGEYYTEHTEANHDKEVYKNEIAADIGAFVTSAIKKGGYYIGRYEAGDGVATYARTDSTSDENTVVCKAGQYVYNHVTQPQASSLSQNMYKDSKTFTSDLINSYAWDTAIVFIQTFSTGTNASNYANINNSKSLKKTGENMDGYCNIHDMSGNAQEWATETYSDASKHCVARGGWYSTAVGGPSTVGTNYRSSATDTYSYYSISFRPLLYVVF